MDDDKNEINLEEINLEEINLEEIFSNIKEKCKKSISKYNIDNHKFNIDTDKNIIKLKHNINPGDINTICLPDKSYWNQELLKERLGKKMSKKLNLDEYYDKISGSGAEIYNNNTIDNQTILFHDKLQDSEDILLKQLNYKHDNLDDLINKETLKIDNIELSSYLEQYDILMKKDNIESSYKTRDDFLLEDLTIDNIENICKNPGNCINMEDKRGINKLHTMLFYKLTEKHKFKRLLNNIEYYLEMNNFEDFKPLFDDIRKNTNIYVDTKVKNHLDVNMKNILVEDEVVLYIDKLDKLYKKNIKDDNNFGKNDINMNPWDLENIETIYSSFKNNAIFKECINSKMTKNLNNKTSEKTYNEFMKRIEDSNDNFLNKIDEDDIDMIVNICKSFEELSPTDIMNCLENINIDPILNKKICHGTITLQSVDVLFIVLSFFGIHINSDNVNDGNVEKVEHLVNRITPYVQKILRKILDMAEYIEGNHCDKISNNTKILKTFYNKLFHTRDPIKYPFSDYKIKFDWFKEFNNPIGKVILLVFVAFIFAQIVKLFTMRGEALQK